MKEENVRSSFVVISTLSYIVIILIIFYIQFFWPKHLPIGFTEDDTWSVLEIITPIFSAYFGITIEYYQHNRYKTKRNTRSLNFAFQYLLFVFLVILIFTQVVGIFLKAYDKISIENLRKIIGFSQLAFGAYIGSLVKNLFKNEI